MIKFRMLIDAIMMASISVVMIVLIDNYITDKECVISINKISKLEHQRDSVINLYFNSKLDTITNTTHLRVNIHNQTIRDNVDFGFSTYPIFSILPDKSLDGYLLLALQESVFINEFVYSNYNDTFALKHKDDKYTENFIVHYSSTSEAIIFDMYYPSMYSNYSVRPTHYENMLIMLANADSAFVEFKGKHRTNRYTLDSTHIKFLRAIHEICDLSKDLELELLNNDTTFQLNNGRYLDY